MRCGATISKRSKMRLVRVMDNDDLFAQDFKLHHVNMQFNSVFT